MRPVHKGAWPTSRNGRRLMFANYKNARNPLAERIGWYCSYCELPKKESLDVEHKAPKSLAPELETDWDNFLLACTACNSRKDAAPDPSELDNYLWPDRDNTFRALDWSMLIAQPLEFLRPTERAMAERTIDLCKLAAQPPWTPQTKDTRVYMRLEAHQKALHFKRKLDDARRGATGDTRHFEEAIAALAVSEGFFSIWMMAFADDPDMRRRFIEAFPGTARDCFDADGSPVPRPGGRV
jgi:hypothetical protein